MRSATPADVLRRVGRLPFGSSDALAATLAVGLYTDFSPLLEAFPDEEDAAMLVAALRHAAEPRHLLDDPGQSPQRGYSPQPVSATTAPAAQENHAPPPPSWPPETESHASPERPAACCSRGSAPPAAAPPPQEAEARESREHSPTHSAEHSPTHSPVRSPAREELEPPELEPPEAESARRTSEERSGTPQVDNGSISAEKLEQVTRLTSSLLGKHKALQSDYGWLRAALHRREKRIRELEQQLAESEHARKSLEESLAARDANGEQQQQQQQQQQPGQTSAQNAPLVFPQGQQIILGQHQPVQLPVQQPMFVNLASMPFGMQQQVPAPMMLAYSQNSVQQAVFGTTAMALPVSGEKGQQLLRHT
eukprot:Hpha_TRINITY_DN15644_c1_g3::TRINITY_DN15644_c1_g3_i1::g.97592::m.97592